MTRGKRSAIDPRPRRTLGSYNGAPPRVLYVCKVSRTHQVGSTPQGCLLHSPGVEVRNTEDPGKSDCPNSETTPQGSPNDRLGTHKKLTDSRELFPVGNFLRSTVELFSVSNYLFFSDMRGLLILDLGVCGFTRWLMCFASHVPP